MKIVKLFSNIFPLYRKSIWDELLQSEDIDIEFYFSFETFNNIENVNLEKSYSKEVIKKFNHVKNIFFLGNLIWQSNIISNLFKKVDVVIFLGEMTIISTWLAAILFKLKGVKVIFWGHGSYGNEKYLKKYIRLNFLRLANLNLVYGKRAKNNLLKQGFKKNKISVVFNSINYFQQLNFFKKYQINPPKKIFKKNLPILLFIGRLVSKKKIDLLIETVLILNKEDAKFNLLIIGDGPQRKFLEELANPIIMEGNCIFYGATYDEKELSKLIYMSDLTVSPGNIGLTAIHSLSYGTPVCSHSNFNNQMPESEAIINFENGFFFQENSVKSMVLEISNWFKVNKKINRLQTRKIIDKYYNPIYQKKTIIELILSN